MWGNFFYEFPQHIILLQVLNVSKNIFPPQNFGISVTHIAVSFQFDLSKIQMLSISFYYQFPPSTVLTSMLRSHGSCSLDFTIFCQEKHLYDFFLTPAPISCLSFFKTVSNWLLAQLTYPISFIALSPLSDYQNEINSTVSWNICMELLPIMSNNHWEILSPAIQWAHCLD